MTPRTFDALRPILLGPILAIYAVLWLFLSMTRAADVPKSPKFLHLRGNYSAGYVFEVRVWIEPHPDVRVIRLDVWDAEPDRRPFADIAPDADLAPIYKVGALTTYGSQREVTELTHHDKVWHFRVLIGEPGTYWLVVKIATRSWHPLKETRRLIYVT